MNAIKEWLTGKDEDKEAGFPTVCNVGVPSVANRRFNRQFCSKQPFFKNSFLPDAFRGLIIYIGLFYPKTAEISK